MSWRKIAQSEAWSEFWGSEAVQKIVEGTTRMITHGKNLDVVTIARLQSRLQTLEELEGLPLRLAKLEEEAAQREVVRRVAGDGPWPSLPRVD